MSAPPEKTTPIAAVSARALILQGLGVKRVAAWCGVSEYAVYQWLSRGTPDQPIPPARVVEIMAGARAEGLEAPLEVLNPRMAQLMGPVA